MSIIKENGLDPIAQEIQWAPWKRIQRLLAFLLTTERVEDLVEDWDEDEDEDGVDDLHLVGQDDDGADLAVHAGGLESPAGTLESKWYKDILYIVNNGRNQLQGYHSLCAV